MAKKETIPQSLYESGREFLREQIRTNEILADIAGAEYTPPEGVPNGKYMQNKWLLDAAQKKNELLEEIAETGGVAGGGNKLAIDYGTDVLSLKKGDNPIPNSGVTLPAYGVTFDSSTGGLTLTKNGTAVQGQTVTIPNYGSPVAVEDSADMTDHDVIYLYEGTTGATYTNGHFYYWDGAAWADGGEYAAATVQTDKTLLVEDAAADAKATGDAVAELKTQINPLQIPATSSDIGKTLLVKSVSSNKVSEYEYGDSPNRSPAIWIDADGTFIGIDDAADDVPVKQLSVELKCTQSGSGDPTPENVRPIIGQSNAQITLAKKNLFRFTAGRTGYTWADGSGFSTISEGDSFIKINGTAESSHQFSVVSQVVHLYEGTYTISLSKYNSLQVTIGSNINVINQPTTFTLSEPTDLMFTFTILQGTYNNDEIGIQIERGANATEYEAYDENDVEVEFPNPPSTVYNGEFDFAKGLLTVSSGYLDLGTVTWVKEDDAGRFYFTGVRGIKYLGELICSEYKGVKKQYVNQLNDYEISVTNSAAMPITRVRDTSKASLTAEEFKSAMSGVQLVFEKKTIDTYAITPTVIKTSYGVNNIWSESGRNIHVTYSADTSMYLNDNIPKFDYTKYEYQSVYPSNRLALPILYLDGNIAKMNKDTKVTLSYRFKELAGTCTCKWQGASSLAYPKKNYTVTFDNAFTAVERWGSQKKYVLKSEFFDNTHTRNTICAKLWGEIAKNREEKKGVSGNAKILASPNYGAMDGFHVMVVINGEYKGLYTFGIPKDAWMFDMTDLDDNCCVLNAEVYGNQSTRFRATTTESAIDNEESFSVEYASDDMTLTKITNSINDAITAVLNSQGVNYRETMDEYVDVDSAIDYLIFSLLTTNWDGIDHNYNLSTYDGKKWYFNAYDLDNTIGMIDHVNADQNSTYASQPSIQPTIPFLETNNRALYLPYALDRATFKARYTELRSGIMSEYNVINKFYNHMTNVSKEVLAEEYRVWPGTPKSGAQSVDQIATYYILRCKWLDEKIAEL